MTTHAAGTFHMTNWDEDTYEKLEGEAKLTKATILQDFSGDLEATGSWETLMCYRDDGTAVYLGFQRMVGRLGGKEGSFVLRAQGTFDGNEARSEWSVVDGSATGELEGLRGGGRSAAPHGPDGTYELDYDIAS